MRSDEFVAARGGHVPAPLPRGRHDGDRRLHGAGVAGTCGRRLDGAELLPVRAAAARDPGVLGARTSTSPGLELRGAPSARPQGREADRRAPHRARAGERQQQQAAASAASSSAIAAICRSTTAADCLGSRLLRARLHLRPQGRHADDLRAGGVARRRGDRPRLRGAADRDPDGGARSASTGSSAARGPGERYALKVRAEVVVLAAGRDQLAAHLAPEPASRSGGRGRTQPAPAAARGRDRALPRGRSSAWRGIPQGYVVDEFLAPRRAQRRATAICWCRPSRIPVAAASMLPGYGAAHRELMTLYPRLGAIGILLHDHTRGRLEFERRAARRPCVYRLGGDRRGAAPRRAWRRRARSASPPAPRRSSCRTTTS